MKSGFWIGILAVLLLVCAVAGMLLLGPAEDAAMAEVWSGGAHLYTLDLGVDQTVTVDTGSGVNVITVRDGKIAVTEADCPDGYCVARGFCGGGTDVVCLPHRLVISFVGEQTVDAVIG